MRISSILESVVDLSQQRERKQTQHRERAESIKSQAMYAVDHAVAATIDHLKRQGMSDDEAYRAVMSHLSDLVMAYDMQGGMVD